MLHELNLDVVGGVEYLLKNFLEKTHTKYHHLLVTNKTIHPHLADSVKTHSASIHYLKYWGPLKLPGLFRPWRARAIFNRVQPDVVVSWNRFATRHSWRVPFVYYDHGASWFQEVTRESREFVQNATSMLACSHASRRMLELKFNVTQPIQVIRNPVRPDIYSEFHPIKKVPKDRPIRFGVAGRMIPVKGIPLTFHALHALRKQGVDVELYLAGDGEDRDSLFNLSKKLGLEKEIRFLGVVKNIGEFYRKIDISLCPSLRDPLPLVALESLACGCPVVAAQVDGFPEVVNEGLTGFCMPPKLPVGDYPGFGGSLTKLPRYVYDPKADTIRAPALVSPDDIAEACLKVLDRLPEMSQEAKNRAGEMFQFSCYLRALEKGIYGAVIH